MGHNSEKGNSGFLELVLLLPLWRGIAVGFRERWKSLADQYRLERAKRTAFSVYASQTIGKCSVITIDSDGRITLWLHKNNIRYIQSSDNYLLGTWAGDSPSLYYDGMVPPIGDLAPLARFEL